MPEQPIDAEDRPEAKVCPECGANNDSGQPGCNDARACLVSWLARQYPGEDHAPAWTCCIDEEQF